MIAVIFEVTPAAGCKSDYLDIAAAMKHLVNDIPGFLSVERFESLSTPGKLLSLSFFEDETAVARWRQLSAHRRAQTKGRAGLFADYRLRIAGVTRDYGLHNRAEAPRDSKASHGQGRLTPTATGSKPAAMLIYKILRTPEWESLQTKGVTSGAPIDVADGYVHFSTAQQAPETAAKHFAGAEGLWLLALDAEALGEALKWEKSRGDALFPHLYAALRLGDVLWAKPLPLAGGVHQFPDGIA